MDSWRTLSYLLCVVWEQYISLRLVGQGIRLDRAFRLPLSTENRGFSKVISYTRSREWGMDAFRARAFMILSHLTSSFRIATNPKPQRSDCRVESLTVAFKKSLPCIGRLDQTREFV